MISNFSFSLTICKSHRLRTTGGTTDDTAVSGGFTVTKRDQSQKPNKPYDGFPLSAHPCGQWCKKVRGKLRYFGPWDDPDGSLELWLSQKDVLLTGRDPIRTGWLTIRDMCAAFESSKQILVDRGDLAKRTLMDYENVGKRLCSVFGPTAKASELTGKDFENLRSKLPASWSAVSTNNFIIRTKAILNFAHMEGLIDLPVRTGTGFSRVSQKRIRIEKAAKEDKFFEPEEVHRLLSHACIQMRAMILLGVNAGYGNADCARLTKEMIDWERGWLADPRIKTGVWRECSLWPETLLYLRLAISKRRKRVPDGLANRVFITRTNRPWWEDGRHDAVATTFNKLKRTRAGIHRAGVGFYALRHITQTIGEGCGDPLAVKIIMGHQDQSISARYRERFEPERIQNACEHVRKWLFDGDNLKKS